MPIIDFPTPTTGIQQWTKPKTLEDWPWEKDLGKPFGDINGINPTSLTEDEIIAEVVRRNDLNKDNVNHPAHYKHLGVECIEMTEHMSFCLGNVVKYVYRCNLKGGVEDLEKAKWYLEREIARRKSEK